MSERNGTCCASVAISIARRRRTAGCTDVKAEDNSFRRAPVDRERHAYPGQVVANNET